MSSQPKSDQEDSEAPHVYKSRMRERNKLMDGRDESYSLIIYDVSKC